LIAKFKMPRGPKMLCAFATLSAGIVTNLEDFPDNDRRTS
jgi:hypothetical protein